MPPNPFPYALVPHADQSVFWVLVLAAGILFCGWAWDVLTEQERKAKEERKKHPKPRPKSPYNDDDQPPPTIWPMG
jgi:hypothetical protein